jgi:Transposase DDE domain
MGSDPIPLMVTKKKRNWKEYNESLVRRGELLFDTDFLSGWRSELRKINRGKEGARYRYPSSLMSMLAAIHVYLLPYRQLEGFVRTLSERVEELGSGTPDFTTIYHRISNMNVELDPDVDLHKDVTIAIDSTGIKVSNRGEWIRHKWKVKRGFVKVHLAVDTRTRKIVSMEVTKEDVPDGRMLKPLVEEAASEAHVVKAICDGAYDSKDNFRTLHDMRIEPAIKVRKNSSMNANGCMPRKLVVIEQLKDYKRWKKKHGYGYRWMAESAISSLKRTFGEHVTSIKWEHIVSEMMLKASLYNLFISMNPR